jgi:hypothetical protein
MEALGLMRLLQSRCFTREQLFMLISISDDEYRELCDIFGKDVADTSRSYRDRIRSEFEKLIGGNAMNIEKEKSDPFVKIAKDLVSCGVAACSVEARQAASQFLASRAFLERMIAEEAKRDGK